MADALQLLLLGVPAKSRVGGNFSIAVFSIIIDKYLSDFLRGIFALQFFLQICCSLQLVRQGWHIIIQQIYIDNLAGSFCQGRQQLFHIMDKGLMQAGPNLSPRSLCHFGSQTAFLTKEIQKKIPNQIATPALFLSLFQKMASKAMGQG